MSLVRQSNFELLRIIAILLVLLLHADFFALSGPSVNEIESNTIDSTLRILFQTICIAAVDIFVMISGWFGIKPTFKGFINLIFQTLYYAILIYAICVVCGFESITFTGIKDIILATSGNWFIKSYILLYILAPILNAYIESAKRSQLRFTLTCFYIFQFIYGWLFPASSDYLVGGYSPISFIGLYLLARYIRIYEPWPTNKSQKALCVYLVAIFIFVTTACVVPSIAFGLNNVYGYNFLTYISPTTIACAVLTVILISKLSISNSLVNRLAKSSFAVYLVFVNPNILSSYGNQFSILHHHYTGVMYWVITILIVLALYALVSMTDTARIYFYNRLCHLYLSNKTSCFNE